MPSCRGTQFCALFVYTFLEICQKLKLTGLTFYFWVESLMDPKQGHGDAPAYRQEREPSSEDMRCVSQGRSQGSGCLSVWSGPPDLKVGIDPASLPGNGSKPMPTTCPQQSQSHRPVQCTHQLHIFPASHEVANTDIDENGHRRREEKSPAYLFKSFIFHPFVSYDFSPGFLCFCLSIGSYYHYV